MTDFPRQQNSCEGCEIKWRREAVASPIFFAARAATRIALLLRGRQPSREKDASDKQQLDRRWNTYRSVVLNFTQPPHKTPRDFSSGTTALPNRGCWVRALESDP